MVYRGKFLKADRGGLRTELFDRRYAELSLSISGSVPVKSEDNEARRGLPDLRPTLELGPRLELHAWRSPDERIKLDIGVPVRFPFTLESSSRSVGVVFEPRLNLKIKDVAGFAGWELGAGIGPNFADSKYHQYFYGIDAASATPQRPAFDAEGGYSGAALRFNLVLHCLCRSSRQAQLEFDLGSRVTGGEGSRLSGIDAGTDHVLAGRVSA